MIFFVFVYLEARKTGILMYFFLFAVFASIQVLNFKLGKEIILENFVIKYFFKYSFYEVYFINCWFKRKKEKGKLCYDFDYMI